MEDLYNRIAVITSQLRLIQNTLEGIKGAADHDQESLTDACNTTNMLIDYAKETAKLIRED